MVNKLTKKASSNERDSNQDDSITEMVDWQSLPMLLDEKQASKIAGVSVPFLRLSRCEGPRANRTTGPPFVKLNGLIRYKTEDLRKWVRNLPCREVI